MSQTELKAECDRLAKKFDCIVQVLQNAQED